METPDSPLGNDPDLDWERALRFGIPAIGLVVLSGIPLWHIFFLPAIILIAYFMHVQIFYTRTLAKSFWMSTYLRDDSPIRDRLQNSPLLFWISWAIAVPLAVITYVTLYGYDWIDCIAVAFAICAAKELHTVISRPIGSNLSEHLLELAHLRVYYWIAIFCTLCFLAIVSIAKGFGTDYSGYTSDSIATQTIAEIKHPVDFVQHCSRTLRFSELQLLRVRDIVGMPYGWILYLFFLIPNAIPAFGLVTLFEGVERSINELPK